MAPNVVKLTLDDMVALAAYAASLSALNSHTEILHREIELYWPYLREAFGAGTAADYPHETPQRRGRTGCDRLKVGLPPISTVRRICREWQLRITPYELGIGFSNR